jgi:hypothetical protein
LYPTNALTIGEQSEVRRLAYISSLVHIAVQKVYNPRYIFSAIVESLNH